MTDIHTEEFTMTREEFIRVNTALLLRENAPAMFITPTILVIVIAPLFWWLSEGSGKPWLIALGVVVFLLVMIFVINPIRLIRRRANSQKYRQIFEHASRYEFRDDLMVLHNSDGSMGQMPRSCVSKYTKRSDYYLLTVHRCIYFIPRRSFVSSSDVQEFEKLFSGVEWEYKTKQAVSRIENT